YSELQGGTMKNQRLMVVLIVCLVSLIAGCTTNAARQVYTINDDTLNISGVSIGGQVSIFVNGETVIDSEINYSKQIQGFYNSYKISAQCTTKPKLIGSDQDCDIYVDEEYAGNLFFR
ncbi:TPA: hypothetical protein ACMDSM_004571, partial [Vibrio parahaemolyticus]